MLPERGMQSVHAALPSHRASTAHRTRIGSRRRARWIGRLPAVASVLVLCFGSGDFIAQGDTAGARAGLGRYDPVRDGGLILASRSDARTPGGHLVVPGPATTARPPGAAGTGPATTGSSSTGTSSPPAALAGSRVYFGSTGDSAALGQEVGALLADHAYSQLNERVPTSRMITAGGPWRTVAAAQPGSATYADIVRWADTLKARGTLTFFAFAHEPEAGSGKQGGPADFINAFRRVVTIFRSRGVTNVAYTWQMTAWSFRTSPGDPGNAAKWYPGDAYVDIVGADAYNWFTCGFGQGRWQELSALGDPVVAFARAHGKRVAFPEFGVNADPRRAQWLRNAHQYLIANRSMIRAAFYFQHPPTTVGGRDCNWVLRTAADFAAFGEIARDRSYFTI